MPILTDTQNRTYTTPLFLPVYKHFEPPIPIERLQADFGVRSLITNAFFLYKDRELKQRALDEGIHQLIGFDGLIMTDSGAFQQFSGPLYLSNKKIVQFQDAIGANVISPLDVITSPGDKRSDATKKLQATNKRIQEALTLTQRATLAGVQQGGRFIDLRQQAIDALVSYKVSYVALGSLVPFFTKQHRVDFVGKIIKQARRVVPAEVPIHLYGAGDPLEIPFYVALGCDIFDSSSFFHYAMGDWFMTPYGALKIHPDERELPAAYACDCAACQQHGQTTVLRQQSLLVEHNLWVILATFERIKALHTDADAYAAYLDEVLNGHERFFPDSALRTSWQTALDWEPT